ncbi:MAG: hypothetical protein ABWK01_02250, partial [Infirmifilum sp.]
KPDDNKVWQVILGFHDYMDKLPERLKRDNLPIAFHYWDSDLLRKEIADRTNRKVALFYLADIPSATFDYSIEEGNMDYNTFLDKGVVIGMDAMIKFVEQLPIMYEKIKSLYPDGKVKTKFLGELSLPSFYDGWLADRWGHGLSHTVEQYVSIDQFLTKNWEAWKLVKAIYGYKRCPLDPLNEWDGYSYSLPLYFKAFGIPHGADFFALATGLQIEIPRELIYKGAPDGEWSVSLPDHVVSSLKQNFPNIVIGYGNYFGLFSCKEGLEKDGAFSIFQQIRDWDERVWLWRK